MKTISSPKNINLQPAFWSHGSGAYLSENLLAPSSDQPAHNVALPKTQSTCFLSQEGRDRGAAAGQGMRQSKIQFVSGPATQCIWLPGSASPGNDISKGQASPK